MALPIDPVKVMISMKKKEFRVDNYTKALHKNMIRLWSNAIRAGLYAMINTYSIEVDTGMSLGTLIPLAKEIGSGRFSIMTALQAHLNAHQKHEYRKGVTNMSGTYNSNLIRNFEAGVKEGKKAYSVSFGDASKPRFKFSLKTNVYQYAKHEPSWKSLEYFSEAFFSYIGNNMLTALPIASTFFK